MDFSQRTFKLIAPTVTLMLFIAFSVPASAADVPATLPDPEGKPADMSRPVQVYILLGQSNMLGFGKVKGDKPGSLEHAVKEGDKYPYLVDENGDWTTRKDVRYVRVMGSGTGSMQLVNNDWLPLKGGRIGPEIGIGHYVGYATDAPVLILKSCIGNRSLDWDLLPPGSERFEAEENGKTIVYGGNAETYMNVGEAMGQAMVELLKVDGE